VRGASIDRDVDWCITKNATINEVVLNPCPVNRTSAEGDALTRKNARDTRRRDGALNKGRRRYTPSERGVWRQTRPWRVKAADMPFLVDQTAEAIIINESKQCRCFGQKIGSGQD